MSDSYLFAVGWVFFAAWSALVFIVSVAAFGPDLLPTVARSEHATGAASKDRPKQSAR